MNKKCLNQVRIGVHVDGYVCMFLLLMLYGVLILLSKSALVMHTHSRDAHT